MLLFFLCLLSQGLAKTTIKLDDEVVNAWQESISDGIGDYVDSTHAGACQSILSRYETCFENYDWWPLMVTFVLQHLL